jgi:hypothetical protein
MAVDFKREGWINSMLSFMQRWLLHPASPGVAFTAEFFSAVAFENGYEEAADRRDWGAVFQRAKREGIIKVLHVDGKPQTAGTTAGHRTPLWVRA